MNIFEFGELVQSEERCYQLALANELVSPYPLCCPFCFASISRDNSKQRHGFSAIMRCNNKSCRKRISLLRNSIFEKSELTMSDMFKLFYCFSMQFTVAETRLHINLSNKTIIKWNKIFREKLSEKYDSIRREKLGGLGRTVEIDECHLYTNRSRIGRRMIGEQIWIVGAICRETKDVAFSLTASRNSNFMDEFCLQNIQIGTRIITDGWRGYRDLSNIGYSHDVINHSVAFVDQNDPTIHTNNIERLWRDVRENIPSNVQLTELEGHVKKYMCWRIFLAKDSVKRFEILLSVLK